MTPISYYYIIFVPHRTLIYSQRKAILIISVPTIGKLFQVKNSSKGFKQVAWSWVIRCILVSPFAGVLILKLWLFLFQLHQAITANWISLPCWEITILSGCKKLILVITKWKCQSLVTSICIFIFFVDSNLRDFLLIIDKCFNFSFQN